MKGRILKIKTGYNPNSSSIGLDMVAFLTAGAAVTLLFNTIAAILGAGRSEKQRQTEVVRSSSVLPTGKEPGGA
jgi:hypothetical protein